MPHIEGHIDENTGDVGQPNIPNESPQFDFDFSSLLANLGLSQEQASLFSGENFYGTLAGMFPGVSRAAIEQWVPEFQQQRYDNLLQALQEQEIAKRGFVGREYDLLSQGLGIREGDVGFRQQEALARLGLTQADIDFRRDEAKEAALIETEELAEKLDHAKEKYGADSPEAKKIQADYDALIERTNIEETARQDRFAREQALVGEGGAEAISIQRALERAGAIRDIERGRITTRGRLEEQRIAGQEQLASQRYDIEQQRILGEEALAGQRYARALGRFGEGGFEQQRLAREEAGAERAFDITGQRLGAGRQSVLQELQATTETLGRQRGGVKRQFVEGSQAAREAMKGEATTLRQRGAQTGFSAAGAESLLSRVSSQRAGRALGQMVEQRSQALGDIETRERAAGQRAQTQLSELGFAGQEAAERLRGVRESGQYSRSMFGEQLGQAGEALTSAQQRARYAMGTAGQALTSAQQQARYARGTAQEQADYATGMLGQQYAEAQDRFNLASAGRRAQAQELQDIYGEGGTQSRQLAQQRAEALAQQTYRGGTLGLQLSQAKDIYGIGGAAYRRAQLGEQAALRALDTQGAQALHQYGVTGRELGTELANLGLQERQYGLQKDRDIYGIEQETAAGIAGIEGSMYDYLQSLYSQILGLSNLGAVTPDRVGSRYDPGSGDGSIQAYSPFLMNMIKTGRWDLPSYTSPAVYSG